MHSSLDPQEIQKFSVNTDQWWDEKGPYRLLHQINPTRLQYIRSQIRKNWKISSSPLPYQHLSILDIGCGGGLLCEPLARLGATVTGIDAVAGNIETARLHAEKFTLPITYHCSTLEEWTLYQHSYDIVITFELLEHVSNPQIFLSRCLKLLKPGGLLIVSTLNRTWKSYAFGVIAAEYFLRWVPQGTHQWQKFLKPSEIASTLAEQGCIIQDISGLQYEVFQNQWVLGDSNSVNYFLTAVLPS